MNRRLPKKLERYAAHLARANPTAFSSEQSALTALRSCYARVQNNEDVIACGTGGFEFRKDEDRGVTLWVLPSLPWGVSDD